MKYLIAEIILPLPLKVCFSYLIPENFINKAAPGKRVIVPFGKSKIYTGIIKEIHYNVNKAGNLKQVYGVIDEDEFICKDIIDIWQWLAMYYSCSTGEVFKAAVPSYFRNFDDIFISFENMPEKYDLKNSINLEGMKKTAGFLEKNKDNIQAVRYYSRLHPKVKYYFRLKEKKELENIRSDIKSAKAQQKLLTFFIENESVLSDEILEKTEVSAATVKKAEKNGWIFKQESEIKEKIQQFDFSGLPELNKWQEQALKEIKAGIAEKNVCLLHGITSSGKTLVYLNIIREVIKQDKQVLFLLPEIALTSQIIERLRNFAGSQIEVFHSGTSGKSKLRLWENVKSGSTKMVVGARSAVFLPFKDPGLIVIDEEHDQSYKQSEPSPRYNARDVAVLMAKRWNVPLIMGSATPSGESYYNALKNKYCLVELSHRYKDMPVPDINLLDVRHARKRKVMQGDFHPDVLNETGKVLNRKGQVMILRNRKGYAPVLRCADCGWTASCPNCSVHLTYHKKAAKLKCHHCHYNVQMPSSCPECGSTNLKYFGFGTQKVEEDIKMHFPEAMISRFDQDSLTSAKELKRNISDFENHKTDILVGTQILSKGLDFDNARMIAVLHADQILNYPDFRSFERAYQMLEQVSGRTGRHHEDAQVYIQTSFPDHPVLKALQEHNYRKLITGELRERRELNYPPFVHLMHIHIKTKNQYIIDKRADFLFSQLEQEFGGYVSLPAVPVLEKQSGFYRRFLQVRFPKDKELMKRKKILSKMVSNFSGSSAGRGLRVFVDVDPG